MESIIEKLNKIKTLSEQGIDGEAQAAKAALEKILNRYKLTFEDLEDHVKKMRSFAAKEDNDKAVFIMCCYKILGGERLDLIYGSEIYPGKLYIELTDYEYAELSEFYDFHKRNYRKEFKQMKTDFKKAYQYKHNLYSDTPSQDAREITGDEMFKIFKYASEMQDVSFYKSLTE